jgi:cysteine-rich repeat protein
VVNATAGEACDDDNLTAGDGCSATCGVEAGWDCAGEPSVCGALTCGDGLQVGDEGCDDGNLEGEDGCSATCTVEPGWTCFGTTPSQCLPGAFVTIAAGTFTMGSPVGEPGREVTEVQHQVTLTGAFEIYATEVTQLQFDAVMGYNDSANQGCPTCPVEQVSWSEAAAYCNALSVQAGYPTCYACTGTFHDTQCDLDAAYATPYDCPGYRLPTEAEWEYATRAGTTGGTYNGTSPWIDNNQPNPVLDPIAWFGGNSANHTHPVGELQPNAWGLYDTLGNAYEWVHDWSEAYAGDAIDPWGPSVGAFRGYRGGSYYDVAACARAGGYRFRSDAWGTTKADLGFRPARSL